MTNQQHPITPPPELRYYWRITTPTNFDCSSLHEDWLIDRAAQWGSHQRDTINEAQLQERADQELEACTAWLRDRGWSSYALALYTARRPKPPTLAEQATADLDDAVMRGDCITTTDAMPVLRAALARLAELEALPND